MARTTDTRRSRRTPESTVSGSVLYGGQLYRAGGNGKIQVSSNGGATWKLHSDLGDVYTVTGLAVDPANRLRAAVDFRRRTFTLVLAPDLALWLTT